MSRSFTSSSGAFWDVSAPFVRSWIRDELGPEAAIANRLREDAETLNRIPGLIRRLEEKFPPKGGAPDPPPLPEIELMWERKEREGAAAGGGPGRLGQAALLLLGAGAMAALFGFGVLG